MSESLPKQSRAVGSHYWFGGGNGIWIICGSNLGAYTTMERRWCR